MSFQQFQHFIQSYEGSFIQFMREDQFVRLTPQEFQTIIRSKFTNESIAAFKERYIQYKKIRKSLQLLVKGFGKFTFIDELYEIMTIIIKGAQLNDFIYPYQACPVMIDNELRQPVLQNFSLETSEIEILQILQSEFSKLFPQKTQYTPFEQQHINNQNQRQMLNFKTNNEQELVFQSYGEIYTFLKEVENGLVNKGVIQSYINYKFLQECLQNLKQFFLQERKLYKVIIHDEKNPKQLAQIANIHPDIDSQVSIKLFQQKLEQFQFIERIKQSQFFLNLTELECQLQNIKFSSSQYNITQTSISPCQQYLLQSEGDDYIIKLAFKKPESTVNFSLPNKGLHLLTFSNNSTYFGVIQYYQIDVYNTQLEKRLHLEIDLDYKDERFLNLLFYSNEQRLLVLSELRIRIQILDKENKQFILNQIVLFNYCSLNNSLNIQPYQQEYIIQIKSKINQNQYISIRFADKSLSVQQYYIF